MQCLKTPLLKTVEMVRGVRLTTSWCAVLLVNAPARHDRLTLSARTQELLQSAGQFALGRGQRELDALHVLRVLVDQDPASEAVRRIGDPSAIARAAEGRLPALSAQAPSDSGIIAQSV